MPKTKKPSDAKPKSKPKSKPKPKAKPKKTAKPKVLPTKPPVVMREKTPCCTDVLKTGQAYTLPLGFVDYKGTQRIGQEPKQTVETTVPLWPSAKPFKTLGEEPTSIIPSAKKSSVSTTTTADVSTQVDTIRVARRPQPTVPSANPTVPLASAPLPTIEESETPVQRLLRSGVIQTIKVPKKNSRADLENRYEAMTGGKYSGPKLTNAEFRELVEFISNKKNI